MIEFFIKRTHSGGYRLIADGGYIATFCSEADAADAAIGFAQDNHAIYSIYYPL